MAEFCHPNEGMDSGGFSSLREEVIGGKRIISAGVSEEKGMLVEAGLSEVAFGGVGPGVVGEYETGAPALGTGGGRP